MTIFNSLTKKIIVSLGFLLSFSFLIPITVHASPYNAFCSNGQISPNSGRGLAGANALCKDNPSSNPLYGPSGIIDKVINIVTIVAGVAAIIMIIIAGLQFVLANGDSKRVESARNTIIFTVVGLVVIVLARFIIEFVVSKIG